MAEASAEELLRLVREHDAVLDGIRGGGASDRGAGR
jgi:hypothetical protein